MLYPRYKIIQRNFADDSTKWIPQYKPWWFPFWMYMSKQVGPDAHETLYGTTREEAVEIINNDYTTRQSKTIVNELHEEINPKEI